MNESPTGRDGFHVYKQDFPMEFWYGLTPDANRETSENLIDVRSLPERYRTTPVEVSLAAAPQRSWNKLIRDQKRAHALAFAKALADGYDLEAHMRSEREKLEAEDVERRAGRAERQRATVCLHCGMAPATIDGECQDCFEIPF